MREEAAGRGREGEHLASALRAVGHKASVGLGWRREVAKQEQEACLRGRNCNNQANLADERALHPQSTGAAAAI